MMELLLLLLFIAVVIGGTVGYRVGWNRAITMNEQRTIERTRQQAEQDRI